MKFTSNPIIIVCLFHHSKLISKGDTLMTYCRLVLSYIKHIVGFYNTVDDTWISLPIVPDNQDKHISINFQWHLEILFATSIEQRHDNGFPLDLLIVHREQQKYPININTKTSA